MGKFIDEVKKLVKDREVLLLLKRFYAVTFYRESVNVQGDKEESDISEEEFTSYFKKDSDNETSRFYKYQTPTLRICLVVHK